MPAKTVIKNTPSGPIEIVFDGSQLTLQFNCNCQDALPICHAACCRYRPFYNVGLQPEEVEKYKTEQHTAEDSDLELTILQHEDNHCTYLNEDSLCEVHDDKPCACKEYHCSPRGGGPEIQRRDGGWVILPLKPEV